MPDNAFSACLGVPRRLVSGDFWTWRVAGVDSSYPESDFSLGYIFAPISGGASTAIPATSDADGVWSVSVLTGVTSTLAAGGYTWALVVTRTSDGASVSLSFGSVDVTANPADGGDSRTIARRHLDAINAVLDKRITKDVENYTIEGRALTRVPLEILHALRSKYMREVSAESAVAAGRHPGISTRKVAFK